MGAMPAIERRRIHLTETPRIAAIIQRHTVPGEPKAATVARLLERADSVDGDEIMVFHPRRRPLTGDEVADLLEQDDVDAVTGAFRG